jgi:hypothetical protein
LFSCLGIQKTASNPRTVIRVCRWTSFRSLMNSGRNQHWDFGSRFPGVDQEISLMYCSKSKVRGMK